VGRATVCHRRAILWHESCSIVPERFERGQISSFDMLLDDQRTRVMLSPREREVAQLVARGLSNKEVARELGLSDGTVKIHVHSIFQKLGAKSRYRLIAAEPAK
jgi:DNA-binding NarL/FixJ family response regulator